MTAAIPPPAFVQLDEQALARLRELDADGSRGVTARVMRTYETSLLRLSAELATAGERGDTGAVARIAHQLKSSSAIVGALTLADRCAAIERDHVAGPIDDLAARVDDLLMHGDDALLAVRAMLQQ